MVGDWCVLALFFLRAKARPEFSKTGVYILSGPETDSSLPRIYVGEGDPTKPRMEQHYAKKDFWTTLFLFTSKDEYLNKAHIQYLEARLISIASEAKRCELDNGNQPALPSMSEVDIAEAERFLNEMLVCFPVLGLTVFEKPTAERLGRHVLFLRGKGIEAKGFESSEGFVVLAQSQAVKDVVPSAHRFTVQMRESLAKKGVLRLEGEGYRFAQDYVFDSPSTAAGWCLVEASTADWSGRTRLDAL